MKYVCFLHTLSFSIIILTLIFLWSCSSPGHQGSSNGVDAFPARKVLQKPDLALDSSSKLALDSSSSVGHWVKLFEETFERLDFSSVNASWSLDNEPDDDPFSDKGIYFTKRGVTAPVAYRLHVPFGEEQWLTAESYSRSPNKPLSNLMSIVADPSGTNNRVLLIQSPEHTDATILRSSQALPKRYRISLRVGYAEFGDGQPGLNGYQGGERAEPWLDEDATVENGFYWLTILDTIPRPHNNVWLHHHRKVVIDSDNHYPPWMEIFDGHAFQLSGAFPVAMFAIDGRGKGDELTGKPFICWADNNWQPSGKICAADAYKPHTWYTVTIERSGNQYTLQISGDFKFGGHRTYIATIDAAAHCVWHYNTLPLDPSSSCVDNGTYPSLDGRYPFWPANVAWPDYFMLGDPHINYYEGKVYYDDIRLEGWKE